VYFSTSTDDAATTANTASIATATPTTAIAGLAMQCLLRGGCQWNNLCLKTFSINLMMVDGVISFQKDVSVNHGDLHMYVCNNEVYNYCFKAVLM
jgi:hypothetical protein